jgi:hypothetical protein
MTRDETIEAMAREMRENDRSNVWPNLGDRRYKALATAAYDAVVPALRQAEREAMRDKCVRLMENRAFTERNSLDGNYNTAHFFDQSADALRALDIGGQDG